MFSHELIRQTVLGELSPPRRARMHARVAEALERYHADALEPRAATIAHHLLEAGPVSDPKRTFHFLLLAGTFALDTAAFEEALDHLERAAERIEAATATQRAELLWRLGAAQRANGRWGQAIQTWNDALDACEAVGDTQTAGWICTESAYNLGWAGRFSEGLAIAQQGLDLLGDE